MEADIASQSVGLGSSVDFSLWSLFIRADIIVKSVIILLIAASIYTWAIIIEKFKLFKKINITTQEFEEKFWKARSAESFYNNLPNKIDDPMAKVFINSMQVLLKSKRSSDLDRLNGNFTNNDNSFRRKINRSNGNVQKLISKYNDLAREALCASPALISCGYFVKICSM